MNSEEAVALTAFVTAVTKPLVGIHEELRRLNEGRDQWYREVLEVLSAAKDSEGSLRSEQPAAAPDGQEGGQRG